MLDVALVKKCLKMKKRGSGKYILVKKRNVTPYSMPKGSAACIISVFSYASVHVSFRFGRSSCMDTVGSCTYKNTRNSPIYELMYHIVKRVVIAFIEGSKDLFSFNVSYRKCSALSWGLETDPYSKEGVGARKNVK
jgi:hypothetical protein